MEKSWGSSHDCKTGRKQGTQEKESVKRRRKIRKKSVGLKKTRVPIPFGEETFPQIQVPKELLIKSDVMKTTRDPFCQIGRNHIEVLRCTYKVG